MPPEFVKCPICKRLTVWEGNPDRPFCSDRCRLIDLGAWASEGYAVPGDKILEDQNTE
jgi:endogenous inhibitor of DNA gyrase (YacG/DUF329 family)